jgi:hypothetical protein
MKATYILFALFIVLQVADVLTTMYILKRGIERNLVLKWIMDKIGVIPTLVISKVIIILLVWWLTQANAYGTHTLIIICVLYVGILTWNLIQCRKIKG